MALLVSAEPALVLLGIDRRVSRSPQPNVFFLQQDTRPPSSIECCWCECWSMSPIPWRRVGTCDGFPSPGGFSHLTKTHDASLRTPPWYAATEAFLTAFVQLWFRG